MGDDFEFEVDCASATPVRFTQTLDQLRESANFHVRAAFADGGDQATDDERAWRAAAAVAHTLIAKNLGRGPGDQASQIWIDDADGFWLIPESSIRWVRVNGPSRGARRSVGFRMDDE